MDSGTIALLYTHQANPPPVIKKEAVDFSFNQEQLEQESLNLKDFQKFKVTQHFRMLNNITNTKAHGQNEVNSNDLADYNRYIDILPYKHSIVKLQGKNEKESYINADYINSPLKDNAYIATQGPIPSTFFKFWKMVQEKEADTIFMLCKEREGNRVKCERYWPQEGQDFSEGGISVKFLKEVANAKLNVIERSFQITHDFKTRNVTQIHWEGWPDHGVPEERDYPTLIELVQRNLKQVENSKIPIVHCSAGVGRTGTLIGLTNIYMTLKYHQIKKTPIDSIKLNVFDIVRRMREQRIIMVQTDDQLKLIFEITKQLINIFQKSAL